MKWKRKFFLLWRIFLFFCCLFLIWDLGRTLRRIENMREAARETQESDADRSGKRAEKESGVHRKQEEETEASLAEAQRQEWLEEYRRWRLAHRKSKWEKTNEEETEEEPPYEPPTLMLASDLHYMSGNTHDDGEAFLQMLKRDDGKVSQYSDAIVDALVEQAIRTRPTALLLTGDISLNGERENHQGLSEKLRRVEQEGISVFVVPGNHDIQNRNAAVYFGKERKEAPYVTSGQEFYEIYRDFGFDQAISRDEDSLSYLAELDKKHWLLLLDTCQYADYNHVNGKLSQETLAWIEEQLKAAKEQEIEVVAAGHHNLLSESRLYTTECTMENHQEVTALFETYRIPLYISGHLHAQRIKKHLSEPAADREAYSIFEIVLSPYSLPPCQYGVLKWNEAGDMAFDTERIPMEQFAETAESPDPFLLDFERQAQAFLKTIVRDQVKQQISGVPDDLKEEMSGLYAELYYDYCAGNRLSRETVEIQKAYRLWERVAPDSRYVREMGQMIEDVRSAQHEWSCLYGPDASEK